MKRPTEISPKLIQRINIQFCVSLHWNALQTIGAIEHVFGDGSLSRSRIRYWHNAFLSGRTTVVDLFRSPKAKSGRSAANIARIKQLIEGDRRLTVKGLEAQTGICHSVIHNILRKDLGLCRKTAKFVPHLLSGENQRERLDTCRDLLNAVRARPSTLKRIVTMDEAWVYTYDPELKAQSSQWLGKDEPRPQKARRARAVGKTLLISFFDWRGLIHREFLRNRTVNSDIFIGILGCLRLALNTKRPNLPYILHMDNASPHTSRITRLYLLLTGFRVLRHPPYSPDLAPSDYWFFHRVKKALRGRKFGSLDELEDAVDDQIANITSEEYKKAILVSWPMRWARCVFREGQYFEGLQ